MHFPGVATYRFSADEEEVCAYPDGACRPDLIDDTYARTLLPFALQAFGYEALHASAVETAQGVLALCAVSGTGKSTLAYGLSRRGFSQWADDAVVFDTANDGIETVPLPFRANLRPASSSFFGSSEPALVTPAPAPLAAVCVLVRETAAEKPVVSLSRLSPVVALSALLPHAHCFSLRNRERKRRMIENYLALAARVPVFEVRFQEGFDRLETVLDVLDSQTWERREDHSEAIAP